MMKYDENDLNRDLSAMQDEVPPMPENLHAAWMERVANEPQDVPAPRKVPLRRQFMRGLAAAAAVVFVAAGATMTSGRIPAAGGGAPSAASFKMADSSSNDMAMYSRAMGGSQAEYGYDGGVMLTSDMAAAEESAAQERKIIRSVSLTIATDAFTGTLENIKTAAQSGGGWIESVTESGDEGSRRAWMTLRIPADMLDTFLAEAGSAGRVTNRSETAQDVTESYYDTQARLESKQLLLGRLQELVAMAESLEDILALERQMADVQYEIDRLQESLLHTDRQVDYATVDITLREETPADQAADDQLSFGQRIAAAIEMGGIVFAEFLQNAAVWLVSAVPFAAVVAAVWGVWRIIRRKKSRK